MNEKQELLAEKIIELHIINDGIFNWRNYYYNQISFLEELFGEKKYEQSEFVKKKLVEIGLIEITNETGDQSQLLMNGYAFTSFTAKRKIESKKNKEERIKSFPQRYWLLLSVVGYISGLATDEVRYRIFPKPSPDTIQLKRATPALTDTILNRKTNPS